MKWDTLASDWDQSLAYLIRLDNCCQALNAAKFDGPDYDLWVKSLWAFYLELSSNLYPDVLDRERKAAKKALEGSSKEEIAKALADLKSEQQVAEDLLSRAENGLELDLTEMARFKRFVTAEKYLRTKMRERGLLIKLRNDPGMALSGEKSY